MFHVIARMQIKPEYFDEFMKIFKANVPTVLAEDGCLEYVPCLDFDTGAPIQEVDSLSMTVVECWRDEAAWRAHMAAPHMKQYAEAVAGMRESTRLTVVVPA